ncbi:bifunctional metallophosphatase/5'-nucleotidase [Anaerobacillus sp. MEB173]|uniref:bifunctional metallophosphatase/5'-nucleotidase n=1 Tax=Anaerobacillus sp. MEB173 TaxID=3383345 RepID=UPI003F8E89D6
MSLSQIFIYHTNDLHSRLENWPKVVSYFKKQREHHKRRNESALFFDIGDHADRVHPITEATNGKGNVRLMNEAGFHNATIGNNEGITFSKEHLDRLYDEANFNVLVANLFEANGDQPTWTQSYDFHQLDNGLTVGVIGMTMPYYPFYRSLGWDIKDPFELLPSLVEEVRKQADIVVLLSHLGFNIDEKIADELEGIDVILGGHTHHLLQNGRYVKGTVIAQAGKFCKYLGQISLTYDHELKEIVSHDAYCIPTEQQQNCEVTEQLLTDLFVEQEKTLYEEVTSIEHPLYVNWFEPSAFAQITARALREWCHAEIGMVNSGVILEGLTEGKVTRGDLHRICPHPINPCKVKLRGDLLKETIQHAFTEEIQQLKVNGFGFRGKVMGMMVFDGIDVKTTKLADGLTHVTSIKIGGKPIDPDRIYEIGTIDMFTFGKLFPAIAASPEKQYYMPELLRDVLAWKLGKENL